MASAVYAHQGRHVPTISFDISSVGEIPLELLYNHRERAPVRVVNSSASSFAWACPSLTSVQVV